MIFPCTNCAACCRRAHLYGLPTKQDGSCQHLTDDNLCSIYDTRPLACRTMDIRPTEIPEDQWVDLNAAACNLMVRLDGMEDKYLVKLEGRRVPSGLDAFAGLVQIGELKQFKEGLCQSSLEEDPAPDRG